MIALYILGGLLLLLLLIGLVKLSFFASYCDGKPTVTLKIGFLTLPVVTGEEKIAPQAARKKRAPAKKSAGKKKKKKKKEKKPAPPVTEPTLSEILGAFRDLALCVLRQCKKHIRLEELRLRVLVASEDAADTALRYGAVCALLAPVASFAEAIPRRQRNGKNLTVFAECDFLADKPEIDAGIGVSFRVWRLLAVGLGSVKSALRVRDVLKRKSLSGQSSEAHTETETEPLR